MATAAADAVITTADAAITAADSINGASQEAPFLHW